MKTEEALTLKPGDIVGRRFQKRGGRPGGYTLGIVVSVALLPTWATPRVLVRWPSNTKPAPEGARWLDRIEAHQ